MKPTIVSLASFRLRALVHYLAYLDYIHVDFIKKTQEL